MNLKLISVLLIATSVMADDGAVYLKKGDIAKYDGFEITPAMAEKARVDSIDLGSQLKINAALVDETTVITQRLTNAQQQDIFLSKQLVDEQDHSFLNKAGYFLAGCLITTALAYGTMHALK